MNKSKCIKVKGNQMVNGVIKVSGSKNASLPIICASIFCNGEVTLKNVPDILDIRNLIELLKYINVKCEFNDNVLKINPSKMEYKNLDIPLMKTFRASYYLIPPLLKENSTFKFSSVGGCSFEERPINFHIDLLKESGVEVINYEDLYYLKVGEFKDLEYTFKKKSVGATINGILLGLKTKKNIVLKNYSNEIEVFDLINFLKQCGLDIIITEDSISFNGKTQLNPIEYEIMPDRIEAETFALIGLGLGKVGIFDFIKDHHQAFLDFLDKNKIVYTLENDFLLVNKTLIEDSNLIELDVYPSLSTDIGPILLAYLLLGNKMFIIKDKVYPSRLSKLDYFSKCFKSVDNTLLVNTKNIKDDNYIFCGSNLRDTMAYLYYSLTHEGNFYIYGKEHLIRGYEEIINKLVSLGCYLEEEDED